MAEYMNKDLFLASMGLKGDETKYGNRDAKHQDRSYANYMAYEIMNSVDDSIEEDVAPVVRCKACVFAKKNYLVNGLCLCEKPVHDAVKGEIPRNTVFEENDFCSYGERRDTDGQET